VYEMLQEKSGGKIAMGSYRSTCEDNIELDLNEVKC
jgi:hypothetical protein